MDFNFLNPFSKDFLQVTPDQKQVRELESKVNSFGTGEFSLTPAHFNTNVGNLSYPYEENGIMFDIVFASKRQRINFYRYMSKFPFVKKLLNEICDTVTIKTDKNKVAKFDVEEEYKEYFTELEFKTLKQEFDYIINAVIGKDEIWGLFKKWLVDGELFLEIILNSEGNRVIGVKPLPPYCTICVYDKGIITGYIQDSSLITAGYGSGNNTNVYGTQKTETPKEIKKFTRNQIAYSNFGEYGTSLNDVHGILESAVRPVNQLRSIQDSLTVYRITRAPEKRIWNIYGGSLPVGKQKEYLNRTVDQYRRDLNLDPNTGLINGSQNTQALTQDIWFMKDRSGNSSSVESFSSSTAFNGQLDDVQMFREEVADALEVPPSRWKTESGSSQYNQGVEGLDLGESSFMTRCSRWNERFCSILKQIFMVQLQVSGYDKKYLDSALYNMSLIPATDFKILRSMTLAEKRVGILGSVSNNLPTRSNIKDDSDEQSPLFSTNYVLQEMLGMSSEEILKNKEMLNNEIDSLTESSESIEVEGGDEELEF